jgi:hypothetical protein
MRTTLRLQNLCTASIQRVDIWLEQPKSQALANLTLPELFLSNIVLGDLVETRHLTARSGNNIDEVHFAVAIFDFNI